jgi:hypothetical protein
MLHVASEREREREREERRECVCITLYADILCVLIW